MANWSGIVASLSAVVRPSRVEPKLIVSSISQLDFYKFKQRGVQGVVIDKDNCITVPHQDELAKGLNESWQELLDTFGQDNVLIVSNSVGTFSKDPTLLGAESVSRNLRVPVLCHSQPKPGFKCVEQIVKHFDQIVSPSSSSSSSPIVSSQIIYSPLARSTSNRPTTSLTTKGGGGGDTIKLLVIGDRLATDLILSSRLSQSSLSPPPLSKSILSRLIPFRRRSTAEPLSSNKRERRRIETVGILTTSLHEREGLGTTFFRSLEKLLLKRLEKQKRKRKRLIWSEGGGGGGEKVENWQECLKNYQPPPLPPHDNRIQSIPSSSSTTTTTTTTTVSREISEKPPGPNHSTFTTSISTRFFSLTSTFLSLPQTLPHFLIYRLPRNIISTSKSLPSKTFHLLEKSLNKIGSLVLESLLTSPRILQGLYKPLEKFTQIYQQQKPEEGFSSSGDSARPRLEAKVIIGGDRIEKFIDRIEEIVIQAKETVQRKEEATAVKKTVN